jgi:hypothetical protein
MRNYVCLGSKPANINLSSYTNNFLPNIISNTGSNDKVDTMAIHHEGEILSLATRLRYGNTCTLWLISFTQGRVIPLFVRHVLHPNYKCVTGLEVENSIYFGNDMPKSTIYKVINTFMSSVTFG